MMRRRIAWQEFRVAWRSRAVIALAAVLTLLTVTAAMVGEARFTTDRIQRARYQALVGEQFADQPDRHPHRVSHYGYLVFRPRAPIGFFDSGLESFAGTSLFLEAHRQNSANFSGAAQGQDRFGELTLATVLQLLLPIFIFATAGVSITREREEGTLALVLCQGASWSHLLWGKLAGTLLTLVAVLAPGLLAAGGWLALRSGPVMDADAWQRVALLLVVHAAFLVTCTTVAVSVSAWQRSSRAALVVLVGGWFVLWIVWPRVLPAISAAVYPVPTRAAFEADVESRLKELGDAHDPDDPVFARLRQEALQQYGATRVEQLPFNYGGLVMKQGEAATTTAGREFQARLEATYRRQERMLAMAGAISPYLAVRLSSMGLAGADLAHLLDFERQAELFRFDLIQALNDLHMREVAAADDRYASVVNGAPTRQRIDAAFFDRLPVFAYRRPRLTWAVRQQAGALLASIFELSLALVGLAWTARRRADGV